MRVGFLLSVMYCSDPGHVEHSTRTLSDPKLLVGTTIQYSCSPGFVMQGGATITCYGREPGTPVWTSRLPHCVCEYPTQSGRDRPVREKRLNTSKQNSLTSRSLHRTENRDTLVSWCKAI